MEAHASAYLFYFNRLGISRMTHLGVAALGKGLPLPANCALTWIILGILSIG
jgi:hypothetical protein